MTLQLHEEVRKNAIGKDCTIVVRWDKHYPTVEWEVYDTDAADRKGGYVTQSAQRFGFKDKNAALRSARRFVDTLAQ